MNKLAFPYNANFKFVIIMNSCKICNETLFWVNCVSFNFVTIITCIFIFDFCVDIAIWVISATCDTKNKISQAICWIALGTRVLNEPNKRRSPTKTHFNCFIIANFVNISSKIFCSILVNYDKRLNDSLIITMYTLELRSLWFCEFRATVTSDFLFHQHSPLFHVERYSWETKLQINGYMVLYQIQCQFSFDSAYEFLKTHTCYISSDEKIKKIFLRSG